MIKYSQENYQDYLKRIEFRVFRNASENNDHFEAFVDLLFGDKLSKKEISVLDVGCGNAQLLVSLKKKGYSNVKYTGLEINRRFVAECNYRGYNVAYGNIAVPIFYECFDAVFARQMLQFSESVQRNIEGMFTCLKKEGVFCISQSIPWSFENNYHHNSVDDAEDILPFIKEQADILVNDRGIISGEYFIMARKR